MKHAFRFLAEPQAPTLWWIVGDELLHLRKVVRLPIGATLEVTDARGRWAAGVLATMDQQRALVEVADTFVEPESALMIEIAFGALKPGSVDDLLPALTELGVAGIHIFGQAETAKSRLAAKVVDRWRRILLQSMKQCKRARMPLLEVHQDVGAILSGLAADGQRFWLMPGAEKSLLEATAGLSDRQGLQKSQKVLVVLGAEVGLGVKEEQALTGAGFLPVSLGPFVLKAKTAALAAAAVLAMCDTVKK